jgi:glycosyltransferase involved in cell wall biosynthesis
MPSPRLSIIIATWNAGLTLQRCLASIEEQSYSDWELLIADGGSTDDTNIILEQHSNLISWSCSGPDAGIYDAWNRAIPHARGEYICFLGADDKWANQSTLETLFSAIGNHSYDIVSSRGLMVDPARDKSTIYGAPWNFKRLGRRMVLCHPGLLHHRSLFETHGFFNNSYRIAGDLEFLLRLPEHINALDLDQVTVEIELAGISRRNVMARLREQRTALLNCGRYGPLQAWLVWLDKLWRYPIAKLLGISH